MSFKHDGIGAAIFFCIGLLFLLEGSQMSSSAYGSAVGAGTFPFALGGLLMGGSVCLFVESYVRHKTISKSSQSKLVKSDILRLGIVISSAILYAVFLEL
ncbi:tripartite tricarboxylate transporter TctB family protein [Geomicrobium sp. JCM 19055]|uniref:tripartite tricarboxylate transporter TctB family protein n=1 Tax=Geomicrobium sp. JCM 19055 TaxID=1460649 RepID=UPI000693A015